jgi:hypothetical protein
MQSKILICFTCILLACSTNHQNVFSENSSITNQFQSLLDQKDYFKLEAKLNLYNDSITTEHKLFYRSFIENAFNRNEAAIKTIDSLLMNYTVPDSIKSVLTLLKLDCLFKNCQYAKAVETDSILLNNYQHFFNRDKINEIKNHALIHSALKNIPSQQVNIFTDNTILWSKDKLGLIEIPVQCRNKNYSCIFDTRASISSITKSYATKLGLKMLDVSYEEGSGITGIKFKTGLGIADSLYIGNILVRNAVFQVMPDSILFIAPAKFFLNIIIGVTIIDQLKEVHIYRDGRMMIPLQQTKSALHNFALRELDPVILLRTDDDTLCFDFDLGATSTQLYAAFFDKYKSKILQQGIKKIVEIGGAGGLQKKEMYVLSKLDLFLANKKITIDSVTVLSQKIYPSEKYYGNIGQDFVRNFNELILNFDYMYVDSK